MRRPFALLLPLCVLCCTLWSSQQALAVLGESEASVESDRKALSASAHTVTPAHAYTVHGIDAGPNLIREYVSQSGVVFAIAWNGLTHPDLSLLLGSYAAEYEDASRAVPREQGRRRHQVKTSRIVVEKWGHMRNLHGRACIPGLVPPEVRIDEIK